jgi:hypothetical protein
MGYDKLFIILLQCCDQIGQKNLAAAVFTAFISGEQGAQLLLKLAPGLGIDTVTNTGALDGAPDQPRIL